VNHDERQADHGEEFDRVGDGFVGGTCKGGEELGADDTENEQYGEENNFSQGITFWGGTRLCISVWAGVGILATGILPFSVFATIEFAFPPGLGRLLDCRLIP